jgi:hypothetical protein
VFYTARDRSKPSSDLSVPVATGGAHEFPKRREKRQRRGRRAVREEEEALGPPGLSYFPPPPLRRPKMPDFRPIVLPRAISGLLGTNYRGYRGTILMLVA